MQLMQYEGKPLEYLYASISIFLLGNKVETICNKFDAYDIYAPGWWELELVIKSLISNWLEIFITNSKRIIKLNNNNT